MCVRREYDDSDNKLFFFQAEDGIRDLVRSRGLGDVYKRQQQMSALAVTYLAKDKQQRRRSMTLHLTFPNAADLSLIHI